MMTDERKESEEQKDNDDNGPELILEEEQDLNIENTNKAIFELSNLIS